MPSSAHADDPDQVDLDALTRRVIEIWSSVLGVDGIEPDSHLLDLGGTSLSAVRIRSRVRVELGRDVDLMDFLEHPTPAEFAAIVQASDPWQGNPDWQRLDWTDAEDAELA